MRRLNPGIFRNPNQRLLAWTVDPHFGLTGHLLSFKKLILLIGFHTWQNEINESEFQTLKRFESKQKDPMVGRYHCMIYDVTWPWRLTSIWTINVMYQYILYMQSYRMTHTVWLIPAYNIQTIYLVQPIIDQIMKVWVSNFFSQSPIE